MYNRFAFGVSKFRKEKISKDLNFQEILIIFPMLFAVFLMGIYPVFFLKYFNFSLLMYYLYF
jgi:NADH:ubiquinone oxidoreductase subunit 4 (subunit M)